MTSRLFWKLFLTFAVLNCVAIFGVARIGWGDSQFLQRLGVWPLVFLVGSLAITWWTVSRVVTPLITLTRSAKTMADGKFEDPVYVGTRDEFEQLAIAFNRMRQDVVSRSAEMKRLSTVLSSMTEGVIAIDESQQVQFANEAAGQMLGFNPTEAQGRALLELVRSHKLHEVVVRLLASKGQQEIEMEWGASTSPRSFLVNATSFSGEPSAGIIMVIHNLSEVRRLEAMRRDFVANVSHELKTPLSSIKAYAETLSQGAINDVENRDGFVKQIEEQADRLHLLISDLLSLARIEQGTTLMEIGQIPLERIARMCVQEQTLAASSKNIKLLLKPSGFDISVKADEDGLRQILINLIDNAIKYTPEGGEVTVGWNDDPEHVEIYVEDTGIGIPEELQPRVYERFFRVDKARSNENGGTGLGLAIVKHLAQSFGGTVEVASEVGVGTRFTIRLPKAA